MGSFTEVFGGNVLYPAGQTYLEITFSADITLQWPIEQQVAGDVVSSIIDMDATVPGLNVDLPDARQVSEGIQSVFTNIGANTITVRSADGTAIISLDSGQAWVAYLTDNTTLGGTWRTFQLGATISVADASALAGAGLKAIATTLNQTMPPASTSSSPVTLTDADRAMLTIWTGGVGVLDLPTAVSVGSDWFTIVRNSGSGDLTITPPSGLIDGFATLLMSPDQSAFIVSDGTNWHTVGLGLTASSIFDFIQIDVSGSGDYTLSGSELNRVSYRFNGLLTNDRNIIVPTTVQQYWVDNSTTGAFDFFVKTAAQVTPIQVLPDGKQILYCDGVDVIDADTAQFATPLTIPLGGTSATDAPTAVANLGALPTIVDLSVEVPVVGDFFAFQDIDDSDANKKATISSLGALVQAQQLFDSGGNVRVSAELLGVTQIRSDGNVDAEVRLLEFAHSDGSPQALIGQPTASITLRIANLIDGGPVVLDAINEGISLNHNGLCRWETQTLGMVALRSDGNTDTEQRVIVFDFQDASCRATIGHLSNDIFLIRNEIHGGNVELAAEDTGGVLRKILEGDPDDDVKLFDEGVEVAHTVPPADGGLEVDNQDTGAGFERVLTTADLGGVSGRNGAKAFRTNSLALTTDVPTVVPFTAESYDTNNFHDTAPAEWTKMTIPAGVSIVILRASISFTSYQSGGKRFEFRKNGFSNAIDDASAFLVSPTPAVAGGVASFVAVQGTSEQIEVQPGDFFEVIAESENQTGVSVFAGSWFTIEVVL